jgi:hypothetical protein
MLKANTPFRRFARLASETFLNSLNVVFQDARLHRALTKDLFPFLLYFSLIFGVDRMNLREMAPPRKRAACVEDRP